MQSRTLLRLATLAFVPVLMSCEDSTGINDVPEAFEEDATWVADLSSEVAGVPATATGRAFFVDRGNSIDYYIQYSGLTSNATNAHLHLTSNGTIYVQLQFVRQQTGAIIGSFDTSPGVTDVSPQPPGTPGQAGAQTVAEFRNLLNTEGLYVNIHTGNNPQGEIRGTIVPR